MRISQGDKRWFTKDARHCGSNIVHHWKQTNNHSDDIYCNSSINQRNNLMKDPNNRIRCVAQWSTWGHFSVSISQCSYLRRQLGVSSGTLSLKNLKLAQVCVTLFTEAAQPQKMQYSQAAAEAAVVYKNVPSSDFVCPKADVVRLNLTCSVIWKQ